MQGSDISILFFGNSLIVLGMAGLVIWFVIRQNRKLLKHQEELVDMKLTHQREMDRTVLDKQEDLRGEIGSEIHDSLGSLLAAIRLKVMRGEKTARKEKDEEIADMLADGIETVRSLSRDLKPITVKTVGLTAALHELASKVSEEINIDIKEEGEARTLQDQPAKICYRMFQELLSNGIRHGQANQMQWAVRWLPQNLELEYRDNGIGFETGSLTPGLGLSNIQDQVSTYSGEFILNSLPGAGTQIIIRIPLFNITHHENTPSGLS